MTASNSCPSNFLETIRVLLAAEQAGIFRRGAELDRLWDLVAESHAAVMQLRSHPGNDLENLGVSRN